MHVTTNSLASEMRAKSISACQQTEVDKEKEFNDHLKASKEIAKILIADLPEFLKSAANAGYDRVYLINMLQYRPWPHEYSKRGQPQSYDNLSVYACKKFLMGVPRILALWALKNGFSISIKNPPNLLNEKIIAPFCEGRIYTGRNIDKEFSSLSPNYEYLVIYW